jgi:hypothetical protein
MARVVTFGRHATTKPPGMLREVIWPQLAKLDEGTNEGMINRMFYFQFEQDMGHFSSHAVGMVDEVTIDGETGLASGRGWVLDFPEGQLAALMIQSQTLRHNSIDLAEVKVEWEEHGDFWDDDFYVDLRFVEWKFAATTAVGKPAFADAEAMLTDEIRASLYSDEPLVMPVGDPWKVNLVVAPSDTEVTASAAGLPSWDLFHVPEPAQHHPIFVGEPVNGFYPVCGHLCLWNTCHDGIEGMCIIPPRPTDGYASINKPNAVLTDRGFVEAGPITLYDGHNGGWQKALENVENVWAAVRVVPGVHGPWLSGYVVPSKATDDDAILAARLNQISGHWKGGRLKVIASVVTPGYEVAASFSTNGADEVDELVASYPGCGKPSGGGPAALPDALLRLTQLPEAAQREAIRQFITQSGQTTTTAIESNGSITVGVPPITLTGPQEVLDQVTVISFDAAETQPEPEDDGPSDEDLALALELE